jgi:hypothetical protein
VMRFGRSPAPAEVPAPIASPSERRNEELYVRHARKDGQLVAVLRAIDRGETCVVEAEVYQRDSMQLVRPGPYTFPDQHQAGAFVTEAIASLIYLGCEIQAE